MTGFPVDDLTLLALRSVCTIAYGDDRTRLGDFLRMGETVHARTEIADGIDELDVTGGHSEHEVICALVDEIERLRGRFLTAAAS